MRARPCAPTIPPPAAAPRSPARSRAPDPAPSSASSRIASARSCARPSCISPASRIRSRSTSLACSSCRSRAVATPAERRSLSRLNPVAAVRSSDSGRPAAATTTPTSRASETSGTTSHDPAGGSNGFATSQLASSRNRSGAPLAMASCHASSSNDTSSRARIAGPSPRDVTKRLRPGLVRHREIERDQLEAQRVTHLIQGPLGQLPEAARADQRLRHTADRGQRREDLGVGVTRACRVDDDRPLSAHARYPGYLGPAHAPRNRERADRG